MYQSIYESRQTFGPVILKPLTSELNAKRFSLERLEPHTAIFRDGERYLVFRLNMNQLTVRIGVGSYDGEEASYNSMRLDDMVRFLYGSLPRGCYSLEDCTLEECLASAIRDLKEFAHEFIGGDFRGFLRILSMKRREDLQTKKDPAKQIYLA